jgi:hypothetical protein
MDIITINMLKLLAARLSIGINRATGFLQSYEKGSYGGNIKKQKGKINDFLGK